MEWNVWDEQVRGMYAGEQLAPPAGIEAAVFRRLDRMRWMRRMAGGLVVSAVAVGGYFAMPATDTPAVPMEVQAAPVGVETAVPVAVSAPAEVNVHTAQPVRRVGAARPMPTSAESVEKDKPEGAPGTARRIDPAQVEPGAAAGLQQRAHGEDRWVLPARIEVKD
jgi:hypothetical protein